MKSSILGCCFPYPNKFLSKNSCLEYKIKSSLNFDLKYFGGEKVKSVVSSNAISSYLVLTEGGNLYTWGIGNRIGINREDSSIIRTPVKIEGMSDVIQITAGKGYFIAIKKDGSVFGTGSNSFGILGRWKGVGRGDSNSRYKTALNWVECPELEI